MVSGTPTFWTLLYVFFCLSLMVASWNPPFRIIPSNPSLVSQLSQIAGDTCRGDGMHRPHSI